jgi:3-ketoacyl-CoA synthase
MRRDTRTPTSTVNWPHVIGTYLPKMFVVGIGILFAQILHQVVTDLSSKVEHKASPSKIGFGIKTVTAVILSVRKIFLNLVRSYLVIPLRSREGGILSTHVKVTALVLVVIRVIVTNNKLTYMLSFSTFKAPDSWKVSHAEIIKMMKNQGCFTDKSIKFMSRLLERSGTG